MDLGGATAEAFRLLLAGDSYIWATIGLSLFVALAALAAAAPVTLLLAYALATRRFVGRRAVVVVLQGLLSFPTVVVGLVLYLLLSRQGALGAWNLLFTPTAMIIGQMIIAFPVLTVLILAAFEKNDSIVRDTARSLGAGRFAVLAAECREARFAIIAAILTGFGRVISEVGCALIVGGNIAHQTRTITTAIALDTGKGNFAEGVALGLVLVAMTIGIGIVLAAAQRGSER